MNGNEYVLGHLTATDDIRAGDVNEYVLGHMIATDDIRAGDVVDVVMDRRTGNVRAQLYRPVLLDMSAMTWTCMVCRQERPDANISVAHRQIKGLEHMFPDGARVNVRYCNDRAECAAAAGRSGVWPPQPGAAAAEPESQEPGCDLAAGVHVDPHRGCLFQ